MKLLPHEIYIAVLKRPWYQLFRKPSRCEASRMLRGWTGQDFGYDAEKWQEWIADNVETFYAGGSNGVRHTVFVSRETTPSGERREVFRVRFADSVTRLEKGKYQLKSEFLGDQILTEYDPNEFEN
jgi:hypothetical protein